MELGRGRNSGYFCAEVLEWALGHCLSPLGLCPRLVSQIPCFQAWSRLAVTSPLQARSPPTRVFDGRRWHRQSPGQWSTHSALAGSGAGALAGFPGRRELSVYGREASKVVCTWGGGKQRGEKEKRDTGLDKQHIVGHQRRSTLNTSRVAMKGGHPTPSHTKLATKVTDSPTNASAH